MLHAACLSQSQRANNENTEIINFLFYFLFFFPLRAKTPIFSDECFEKKNILLFPYFRCTSLSQPLKLVFLYKTSYEVMEA